MADPARADAAVDRVLGLVSAAAASGPGPEAPPPPAAEAAPPGGEGARGPLTGCDWAGYRVGDLLGRGAMGAVYRARQLSVGREVALKVLSGAAAADPALRERFAAEARAAARIHVAQVVAVHDAGEYEGSLWLAMELVEGRSLAEELAARRASGARFTPSEALGLASEAARGLAAAHAGRLVHRDIKPGNLLLGADGRLKVADFGLVRFLDEQSRTIAGAVLGTPQYLSPEQGRGLPADARADVYSLGVVLYEMLTMRRPFEGRDAEELVTRHNFSEPLLPARLNPDISQDLQAVVMKCLQKDPARRFADAGVLLTDLERVHAGLAPLAALFGPGTLSTGAQEALRRLVGWRRYGLAAALALAGAALLLGAGWWWWDARKEEMAALRQRLAPLAQAAPPPATAGADLARLAALAGPGDAAVAAGRAKLAAVAAAASRLAAVPLAGEADAATQAEARAAADALAALVGPAGDPGLAAAASRLEALAARRTALREGLAARRAGVELAGAALRIETAADREAFGRLAGDDDPEVRAWAGLLERSDAARDAASALLGRLDDPRPLSAEELATLGAARQRLLLLAPALAPPGRTHRLEDEAAALALHRSTLGRLLERSAWSVEERAEAATACDWLAARSALDPAAGALVRQRLAAVDQELASLRARLAELDAVRTPPADAEALLARYESLVGLQDARGAAWRARLAAVAGLRARLAALDRRQPPPPGAAEDLRRLAALVGAGDPQVVAWGRRLAAQQAARARLAQLDRPGAPPAWAAADLDGLEALVGGGDADLVRWRARLAEAARLAAALAAWQGRDLLDAEGLAAAQASLAAWRALAGDDDAARAAAARLAALAGPDAPAWAAGRGCDRHGPWLDLAVDGAQQRLRWLPPGRYAIGSAEGEEGHEADEAAATVAVEGLWVADSECGQDLWRAVMGGAPAAAAGSGPMAAVSRAEAEAFCLRLAARLPGCRPRLPDEAEWEAALRAAPGPWGGLDRVQAAGAIVHRGAGRAQPAGLGIADRRGLRHGPGNLREWCRGGYGAPPTAAAPGPHPDADGLGVVRGGSWDDPLERCRPANRAPLAVGARSPLVGFRFVVEP